MSSPGFGPGKRLLFLKHRNFLSFSHMHIVITGLTTSHMGLGEKIISQFKIQVLVLENLGQRVWTFDDRDSVLRLTMF